MGEGAHEPAPVDGSRGDKLNTANGIDWKVDWNSRTPTIIGGVASNPAYAFTYYACVGSSAKHST